MPELDKRANLVFPGKVVRKDLVPESGAFHVRNAAQQADSRALQMILVF